MVHPIRFLLMLAMLAVAATAGGAEVVRREANSGKLLMEDVPEIPPSVAADLNRYQNVRSAFFQDWAPDGQGLFVTTRFGDVNQIHHVGHPGGARTQLTFFDEPTDNVARQPGGQRLVFTMDAGGSEFSQIFLLDPAGSEEAVMLTDGESRNGQVVWDRTGQAIAYQSTRRDGAANDVWMMNVGNPETARIVLEAPDHTWWGARDISADNGRLLILNYISIADSRIHLLDLETGELRLLVGGPGQPSSNFPLGFDADSRGFWFVTDLEGEFRQLAWQSLEPGAVPEMITGDIGWDVENGVISADGRRMAFSVNEDGFSRLYLMDTASRRYAPVAGIPVGVIGGSGFSGADAPRFSPDGRRLALTLNTPQTPSDVFVLELGAGALEHGALTRWTYSEVGGLDTDTFIAPELVRFPTFDSAGGGPGSVPAWVYRPPGDGPHPVIVAIHGGPEGQSRPTFSSSYQMWLQKLGAAVIRPNVRGSAGYGKTYLTLDNGFRREDSVRDIGALLDWIATQDDLDADRVAVIGGSYGGYMVLASAVHFSDRLRGAVDIVGISNFVTFLENTQDYRRDLRRPEYGDERLPEMRAHLEAISPTNNVDKIRVPLFIVQGQNDPRVPVTESEQMVAALRADGRQVWYMNALNEGHGYQKKENRDIYQQATMMFFRRHLLGE